MATTLYSEDIPSVDHAIEKFSSEKGLVLLRPRRSCAQAFHFTVSRFANEIGHRLYLLFMSMYLRDLFDSDRIVVVIVVSHTYSYIDSIGMLRSRLTTRCR